MVSLQLQLIIHRYQLIMTVYELNIKFSSRQRNPYFLPYFCLLTRKRVIWLSLYRDAPHYPPSSPLPTSVGWGTLLELLLFPSSKGSKICRTSDRGSTYFTVGTLKGAYSVQLHLFWRLNFSFPFFFPTVLLLVLGLLKWRYRNSDLSFPKTRLSLDPLHGVLWG